MVTSSVIRNLLFSSTLATLGYSSEDSSSTDSPFPSSNISTTRSLSIERKFGQPKEDFDFIGMGVSQSNNSNGSTSNPNGMTFATIYQPVLNLSIPVYPAPLVVSTPRFYNTLVAIGDSFTDDGHPRIEAYSFSYCVGRAYVDPNGGRCTDVSGAEGRVQVEYMVQLNASTPLSIGVELQLLNYAFAGAQIDNGFLYNPTSNTPATSDQTDMFLQDLADGKVVANSSSRRTLIYYNAGINPVAFIWSATIVNGNNATFARNIQNARDQVTANLIALEQQIRNMNSAVPETLRYADYVILNIPPPQLIKFILDYTTDDAYHRVLEELGLLFNSGVETFVRQFKKEVRAPGRAFFFDLAELWTDFHNNPTDYQLDPAHLFPGCFNTVNGVSTLCNDPQTYLTCDGLHPSSRVHSIIAQRVSAVVMDAQGYFF